MRKSMFIGAVLAAMLAGVLAVTISSGSSHREAPLTSADPTADDTDLYAFRAADAPDKLTVVANWIPFEDPAGGPNFYALDPKAEYYINVDNTGDGVYDVRYQFKFKTTIENKNSFLYALPGVASIDDPKLNVKQSYTLRRLTYRKGKRRSSRVLGRDLPVAPNNVGAKTIPDYASVAGQANQTLGARKVFVGQADDPFFVDLGTTFDAIHFRLGTGNQGGGKDDLAGYNVHSFVLQVPFSDVTRDGEDVTAADAPNAVVGVWSSTERERVVVGRRHRAKRRDVQVSRLGNPLVNEVVIPLGQKDKFNRTQPANDLKNYGKYVVTPELAAVMNILYPGLNVPETDRTDIVQALLTGIPGFTQIAKNAPPTDTLKINLGIPPNASPKRFGVLAGDTQGFPNGRRLTDDVTDIELRVVGGFLKGNKLPLGDGVDSNDVAFRTEFPYVALPHAGFDSDLKRIEPAHPGTPADPNE
ncbi:MAG: hypothetical protein QOI80_3855 [Solirubrobacteraceae bacterium]|jgi:hypothetical protein|nr:hypothetical protein [Solirubrobacteraceae bacterium]